MNKFKSNQRSWRRVVFPSSTTSLLNFFTPLKQMLKFSTTFFQLASRNVKIHVAVRSTAYGDEQNSRQTSQTRSKPDPLATTQSSFDSKDCNTLLFVKVASYPPKTCPRPFSTKRDTAPRVYPIVKVSQIINVSK